MNCIDWFNTLIANGDTEELKREFRQFAKQQGGYFMPKHPNYDLNDESVFYVDIEQDEDMTPFVRSYSLSQFVEQRINDEFKRSVLCISEKSRALNDEEKAEYFNSLIYQLNTLIYLNEKSDVLGKREHLTTVIDNIKSFLNNKSPIVEQHNLDEDHLGETVFGFKGMITEIRTLYNSLENLSFFNPDNNQYNKFYQILITPNHTSTMLVNLQAVTVACDNSKAAYILSKIEPLFSRLTFRSIDKSRLFKNRLGKPFTESDLSKAKTKFKQKAEIDDTLKDEIDRELNLLINKR